MFIRQYFKQENGSRTAYWALVESHRTASGPRQRVVAWLGMLDEAGRLGGKQAAQNAGPLTSGIERSLIEPLRFNKLQLDEFLQRVIPSGREHVAWDVSRFVEQPDAGEWRLVLQLT